MQTALRTLPRWPAQGQRSGSTTPEWFAPSDDARRDGPLAEVGYRCERTFLVRNHTATPAIDAGAWACAGSRRPEASPDAATRSSLAPHLKRLRSKRLTGSCGAGNGQRILSGRAGTPGPGTQWAWAESGRRMARASRSRGARACRDNEGPVDVLPQGLDANVLGGRRPRKVRRRFPRRRRRRFSRRDERRAAAPDTAIRPLVVPGWVGIAASSGRQISSPVALSTDTKSYRCSFPTTPPTPPPLTPNGQERAGAPRGAVLLLASRRRRACLRDGSVRRAEVSTDRGATWAEPSATANRPAACAVEVNVRATHPGRPRIWDARDDEDGRPIPCLPFKPSGTLRRPSSGTRSSSPSGAT